MIDRWMARDSYYGHGFLIPIVSLYWIFKKRNALANLTFQPDLFFGIALLSLGLLVQLASFALRIYFLSAFSLVFILAGSVAFVLGREALRALIFPLSFLILMIPLPLLVISEITLQMKFWATGIAVALMNQCGILTVREGSYVYSPHSAFIVGDPCSGLRSLLAFFCLGIIFAYESRFEMWKKFLLFAAGVPLALFSNVIRIFMLGMIGEIYGMQYTGPGPIHDATGIIVFSIAIFAFFAIRKKLEPRHA